jgi:hypothetical protein
MGIFPGGSPAGRPVPPTQEHPRRVSGSSRMRGHELKGDDFLVLPPLLGSRFAH